MPICAAAAPEVARQGHFVDVLQPLEEVIDGQLGALSGSRLRTREGRGSGGPLFPPPPGLREIPSGWWDGGRSGCRPRSRGITWYDGPSRTFEACGRPSDRKVPSPRSRMAARRRSISPFRAGVIPERRPVERRERSRGVLVGPARPNSPAPPCKSGKGDCAPGGDFPEAGWLMNWGHRLHAHPERFPAGGGGVR